MIIAVRMLMVRTIVVALRVIIIGEVARFEEVRFRVQGFWVW